MSRRLPRLLVLPVIAATLSLGTAAQAATGDFIKQWGNVGSIGEPVGSRKFKD